VTKFLNFRYHGNKGRFLKIPIRLLNSATLETPCLMQEFWP